MATVTVNSKTLTHWQRSEYEHLEGAKAKTKTALVPKNKVKSILNSPSNATRTERNGTTKHYWPDFTHSFDENQQSTSRNVRRIKQAEAIFTEPTLEVHSSFPMYLRTTQLLDYLPVHKLLYLNARFNQSRETSNKTSQLLWQAWEQSLNQPNHAFHQLYNVNHTKVSSLRSLAHSGRSSQAST